MSVFECKNHHIVTSQDKGICPECGERIHYMDGYSAKQLKKIGKYNVSDKIVEVCEDAR